MKTKKRLPFRVLRVGEYPRNGDQFFYVGDAPGEKRGWKKADADLLAKWRGPVPSWHKGRYRRRVLPNDKAQTRST